MAQETEPPRGPHALAALRRALAPTAPREVEAHRYGPPIPVGVDGIDEALGGGLPAGRLVELWGDAGLSLALQILANAERRGLCAFLDGADAFDTAAAQALGIDLARLLWAHPRSPEEALRAADLLLRCGGFHLVVVYLAGGPPPRATAGTWQRLVQGAAHARTTVLVVGEGSSTGSAPAVALACRRGRALWEPAPGWRCTLIGHQSEVELVRNRLGAPLAAQPLRLHR